MTKLSAHAAVICWKFPSGQRKGAHGYYLRYGRRPVDLVASQQQLHGQVLELKLTDSDVALVRNYAACVCTVYSIKRERERERMLIICTQKK